MTQHYSQHETASPPIDDFRRNTIATLIVALLSLIFGLGLIFLASQARTTFAEGLLLNLGTEMLGALVFFGLFELYRGYLVAAFRRQEQTQTRTLSQTINEVAHTVNLLLARQSMDDTGQRDSIDRE